MAETGRVAYLTGRQEVARYILRDHCAYLEGAGIGFYYSGGDDGGWVGHETSGMNGGRYLQKSSKYVIVHCRVGLEAKNDRQSPENPWQKWGWGDIEENVVMIARYGLCSGCF